MHENRDGLVSLLIDGQQCVLVCCGEVGFLETFKQIFTECDVVKVFALFNFVEMLRCNLHYDERHNRF